MPSHQETLKAMLQDIINDRQEQASVTMHDYFLSKSREVAGLGQPEVDEESDSEFDDTEVDLADDE